MKKHLGKIITGAGVVLAVIAIFMMFAPALAAGGESAAKGVAVAFGNKDDGFAVSAYMLAYIVTAIGAVCGVLAIFGKGGNKVRIAAAVAMVIGGIVFFLPKVMAMPDLSNVPDGYEDMAKKAFDLVVDACDVGAGAIVGGLFSILGAVAVIVPMFVFKDAE